MLDCTVYALAAAYHLGMNKFSERDWARLEDIVQPITADLFDNVPKKAEKTATKPDKVVIKEHKLKKKPAPKARRRKNKTRFASNW